MGKSIEDILNEKIRIKDSSKAFYQEIKKNVKLEAVCILACETGEWTTEILGYLNSLSSFNELGIAGGIITGMAYAVYHIAKHARKHNPHISWTDTLIGSSGYAVSTESGCVIGATISEYAAGKFLVTANNPLAPSNISIRAGSLIPAFAIGLVLMSAFTYNKKKEIARWVGEKNALKDIKPTLIHCLNGNQLKINGENAGLTIKEAKLPKAYQYEFDKEKNSLYTMKSKIGRAKPEYISVLTDYCEDLFAQQGCNLIPVENIYKCSGSHENCSHSDEGHTDHHECGCGRNHK